MKKKRLFNFRPVVICVICACLGIAFMKNLILDNLVVAGAFAVAFLLLAISVFMRRFTFKIKERAIIFVACALFFAFGALNFQAQCTRFQSQNFGGHYYDVCAKVVDVKQSDVGQNLILSKVVFNGGNKTSYKIRLYVYGDKGFDVGDVIKFNAMIKDVPIVYENKFSANNVLNKIRYTANVSFEKVELCGKQLTVFERANLFLRDTLKSGLDKNEFAVGYALLTGNSDFMDSEILSAFRMAGVAHVFAVSGLHIGFLAVALSFVLTKLKCNRIVRALVLPIFLFAYSGVCSFTSSSLRASIMTTVMLLLSIKGWRYDRLTSISIAAILILAFSPANLFDAGFQLSFVVVVGITLFANNIKRALMRVKFMPEKLASALAVALSAQLASMPVYLYHFKTASLLAVFLNVVFIPAVSVIFTLLMVCTILGGLLSISKIVLFIPNYLLKLVNLCITAVDYEFFILHGTVTLLLVFAIFWALLFISEYLNVKILTRCVCSLICVIFALTGSLLYTAKGDNSIKLYVCGSEKLCVTVIDTIEQTALIVSYAERSYSLGRLIKLKNERKIQKIDYVIFLEGFGYYEQEFLTKMRVAFSFSGVCCFGERDENTEIAIKKSFGNDVEVCYSFDGQALPVLGAKCEYVLDGKGLEIEFLNERVCIFSSLDNTNYATLGQRYSLMVAKDRVEQLFSFYKPTVGVSYCEYAHFTNGESSGTVAFEYNKKLKFLP